MSGTDPTGELAARSGPAPAPAVRERGTGTRRWTAFVDRFLEGFFERNPTAAVHAGRHDQDGHLPDWSLEGLEEQVRWLRSARSEAEALGSSPLSTMERLEREHVLAEIKARLFWLSAAEWPRRSPSFYAEVLDPSVYLTREYAPPAERMRACAAHARGVPEAARRIRENLRTPLPKAYAEFGLRSFGGLASFLEREAASFFPSVEDSRLRTEFAEATRKAARALRELAAWLEEETGRGTGEFALGPELFTELLRATEGVDVSLGELEEVGWRELGRNMAALREACRRLDPGLGLEECVALVRSRKPIADALSAVRERLGELEAFVTDRELVSVPEHPEVRVRASPPHLRWNAASIDIPGPYDRDLPATFYLTPPDEAWGKEERRAYLPSRAELLFMTVHEVWPGHFLQFLHTNRSVSRVGRVFVGYAFAEGWAHYAEELAWEAGLEGGDPEAEIGQLLEALLRTVRYLAAIGLHTGTLTVEDAERMFRTRAFLDPANARQQAARGTFDPAYLNYTLGKLMIRKLRDDWLRGREGRSGWRAFHDRLLSFGGPPLPLLRRAMLGPDSGSLL